MENLRTKTAQKATGSQQVFDCLLLLRYTTYTQVGKHKQSSRQFSTIEQNVTNKIEMYSRSFISFSCTPLCVIIESPVADYE